MNYQLIRTVGNILALNSQYASSYNLRKGRAGIALFFYGYKHLTGDSSYDVFAEYLIDSVIAELYPQNDACFINELSQVGLAINYILKNQLVEGNPNDILEDVDNTIITYLFDSNSEKDSKDIIPFIYCLNRSYDNDGWLDSIKMSRLKKIVLEIISANGLSVSGLISSMMFLSLIDGNEDNYIHTRYDIQRKINCLKSKNSYSFIEELQVADSIIRNDQLVPVICSSVNAYAELSIQRFLLSGKWPIMIDNIIIDSFLNDLLNDFECNDYVLSILIGLGIGLLGL